MTAGTVREDVRAYLDAVRTRLDDLPAAERDDLLADVEASILESAEESDAPVELRLGPPDSFADELRAAAGLPPCADRAGRVPRRALRERIVAAYAHLATSPAARPWRDLAPLWWVLRGLVAAGLVEILYGESVFAEPDGYALLVALGALVAVVVSVAAGLRRPRRNGVLVAVNLVLALAAVPVIWNAVDDLRAAARDDGVVVTEARVAGAPYDFLYEGRPVENVYAFDREGRLLQDVRLYMQDGRPLAIGGPGNANRRSVRTRTGTVVFNAFPIRYFEPGTRRVANPAAGAPERPDPLATKALARGRR